jgi:hypothetical protein
MPRGVQDFHVQDLDAWGNSDQVSAKSLSGQSRTDSAAPPDGLKAVPFKTQPKQNFDVQEPDSPLGLGANVAAAGQGHFHIFKHQGGFDFHLRA